MMPSNWDWQDAIRSKADLRHRIKAVVAASGRPIQGIQFMPAVLGQLTVAIGAVAIASAFLIFYKVNPIDAYKRYFSAHSDQLTRLLKRSTT